MKVLHYDFYEVTHCNMCGDDVKGHRILGQRLNQSQGLSPKAKQGISVSVMKCTSCGLVYSSPQPVPRDIQDHYGVPPESYWLPEYFEIDPAYFSTQIEKAKRMLPFQPGMKALDIGAGLGKCMISLEKAGFDTYGIEPSASFYDRALNKMNISPDKLKLEMLENANFPDRSFDFIVFGAVLEHLYDPDKAIALAMKWLKPGGLIHIEVPSSKHLIAKLYNFYYWMRGTNYVTQLSPMHTPFHLYEFAIDSFKRNMGKNNYSIAHFEYYVCDVFNIPKILHPPLKWIMENTKTGMQLEVWLRKVNN